MADLEREIERLEGQLTPGDTRAELATVRRGLERADTRRGNDLLPNLRLGFRCKERWDKMVGDGPVRACSGCDRPVFNLSEMTRAQAEAVLATKGLTPCVRFYRRPDGTVMTSDCPTGVPTGRRKLAVLASGMAASATLASGSAAFADEAVPVDRVPTIEQAPADKKIDIDIDGDGEFMGEPLDDRPLTPPVVTPPVVIEHEMGVMISEPIAPRPRLQWSVWGRIGLGVATADPTAVPRRLTMTLPEPRQDLIGEAALAADLTLGVTPDGRMRIGAFGELRTTTDPVAGGEVAIEPARWRRHMTPSIVLRAGGNAHVFTGEVGVGYIGTYGSWTRHAVGGRVVTTFNRSLEAPQDWSVTVGLEVEPIGVLQALVRAAK